MLKIRIETAIDPISQLVSASIHYPVNAKKPIAETAAIFPNHEVADQKVTAVIDEIFQKDEHVIIHPAAVDD